MHTLQAEGLRIRGQIDACVGTHERLEELGLEIVFGGIRIGREAAIRQLGTSGTGRTVIGCGCGSRGDEDDW